jgi:hypothetical protein
MNTPVEATQDNGPDELSTLKDRAKVLGINFSGNIGVDALRKKIQDKLDGSNDAGEAAEEKAPAQLTKQQIRDKLRKEALALVRCRIYNLNPSKRELSGEIVTVGNRYIGTVRKMIPFGEATENGYHIPKIIHDELKSRKFQQIRTTKKNGQIEVHASMVPEYSIEVLRPLTKDELEELKVKQAAAERLGA